MKKIIDEMERLSTKRESFALATVTARDGSAPRSAGAKMLVKQDGGIVGTVGGGKLEAQVLNLAARMINDRGAVIQVFQFDGKDAATMDAICGGQVEVLVEFIDPGDAQTEPVIRGLQAAIAQQRQAWLITLLQSETGATTHALVFQDMILGALPDGISLEKVRGSRLPTRMDLERQLVLIEPVNNLGTAYIFGAGHVSRSLAEFVKTVGFRTMVLDDQEEYANHIRFPTADEIIILDSFSTPFEKITIDRDSYIVIVTRGHLNDLDVLAQALRLGAGYIGMIGSRRKCGLIFEELRRRGFQEADLQRVHAPIGLPIDAETPEEIGISITAEMIQARARLQKQPSW